jgi:diacylglycerol kinase (ATP)
MSMACYVPVGVQNSCCKRPLAAYMTIEVEQPGAVARRLQTLRSDKMAIFQAIPSMYGGEDTWRRDGPRAVDDGLSELTFQGGAWSIGFMQLGCDTGRPCCPARRAVVETTEPCYVQIDGEGDVINGPAVMTIDRGGAYAMIFMPAQIA